MTTTIYNTMQQTINLKRAYEPQSPSDGYRVYIDRLWPQGLSHATFHYNSWYKSIAPSTELRQWFHADPGNRWPEFVQKYRAQLLANPAFDTLKKEIAPYPVVTLLYSSRDTDHNNAVIVKSALTGTR